MPNLVLKASGGEGWRSKNFFLIFSRAPSEFSHTFFSFSKGGSGLEILHNCNFNL